MGDGGGGYQGQVRTVTGLRGQLAATREGDGERQAGVGGGGSALGQGTVTGLLTPLPSLSPPLPLSGGLQHSQGNYSTI